MPSQKNSGNRGSQRESPIAKKNDQFFAKFLSDLQTDGTVEDVYIGRILSKNGNGRMNVFVLIDGIASVLNSHIRGLFRGKGKHSVLMDVGTVVLVNDTKIRGGNQYEIVCALTPDHIYALRKATTLDNRILSNEIDTDELMKGEKIEIGGFDIGGVDDTEELDDDAIDHI